MPVDEKTIKETADKIQSGDVPKKIVELSIRISEDGKWSIMIPDKIEDTLKLQKMLNIKVDDLFRVTMYPQKSKIEKPSFNIWGGSKR